MHDPSPEPRPAELDTVDPDQTQALHHARRGRLARRLVVVALAGFVAAGLAGVFGYRQAHQVVVTADYQVELSHPAVTRGGLAIRWTLQVRRRDGAPLDGPVEVVTTGSYFDLFDYNDLEPQPDRSWQSEGDLSWEFEPPAGAPALELRLDARTQPDARWTTEATTTVRVAGRTVASIEYATWAVP